MGQKDPKIKWNCDVDTENVESSLYWHCGHWWRQRFWWWQLPLPQMITVGFQMIMFGTYVQMNWYSLNCCEHGLLMHQLNGILCFSVNVAFNQPTYQYHGGGQQASSRAVDDNLSTHRDDCTKSHQGAYPWLAVDMGTHRNLAEVDVLNRDQGRVADYFCLLLK